MFGSLFRFMFGSEPNPEHRTETRTSKLKTNRERRTQKREQWLWSSCVKHDLADSAQRAALVARLRRLAPDSPRQWGRMTPHQAMCHLSDSFRAIMGDRSASSIATPFSRTVIKWIALNAPMKWPTGVKTMPEVDQEIGGTK